MFFELAIVLALILLNGVLAMSEIALVSSRTARLTSQAQQGERGAETALLLMEHPGRFFSTIQIGITLVGVLAGAFSGATLGERLANTLLELGVSDTAAAPLGVGGVVVAITYLSLVIGELVPKQIALSRPEAIAVRIAPAMALLSTIAGPLVWILEHSGKVTLAMLGQSGKPEPSITDEEIRLVIAEAEGAGVIEKAETEMITGVMRIADRSARGIMKPRHEVDIAGADETHAEILARFRKSGHSRLPLRAGDDGDIVGILYSRDLLDCPETDFDPRQLAKPATVIHDTLPAMEVMERLRSGSAHMFLVYDEYGHFEGIITPMDILSAIAGGFDEADNDEPKVVVRDDGDLLVAGWMPVDEFAELIGIKLEDHPGYETVAGLVLDLKAELPEVGQHVTIADWKLEVVDMDGRRIDKILATKLPAVSSSGASTQ
ncbi:hemolysin family protein [Roseibium sp.]|uniref:hemolysin family protein n=1 Tax=Roseibium sp. TaxID=1936156 RepID=UPI003A986794